MKIYYPEPHPKKIVRHYKLLKQGLVQHPEVELVSHAQYSDYIFLHYCYVKHYSNYQSFESFTNKIVFIDNRDTQTLYNLKCFLYFKRSCCSQRYENSRRKFLYENTTIWPFSFAVMDEFIIRDQLDRDIDLGCYLRASDKHRILAIDTIKKIDIGTKKKYCGAVTKSKRNVFDKNYLFYLKRTKIVVTCNPQGHEGDWRLWEALASGCLVFVDRMFIPYPNPLKDGEHVLFYDITRNGLEILKEKIKYYLKNETKAMDIAQKGHEFALKYHRAVNRVDEIINVTKKLRSKPVQ